MIDDSELGCAIKVKMLMFGPLAEKVGAREIEVALEEGTTALQLAERFQLVDMIESGLRVAIDGNITSNLDSMLNDAAEIAFLPPVSGG
ncbi:MAG: MoaD/ThiS family protein [Candidatus Thalassarchaeaceae archaeon]|nr:MoaD/ThiS family protein [Candidatus Thalassarchaeaceae archaeon]MDP7004463.1 MoaD/ThiS family protein [Candidatus Thalassarchaeaceae archaeon]